MIEISYHRFLLGCIVFATILVYAPGLGGPFLLDDFSNARFFQLESLDLESLRRILGSNESGIFGRPLSNLSLGLNHYFSGQSTFSYKAANLIIHIVCGLLIYVLFRRLFLLVRKNGDQERAALAGMIAAGIWLLHPIQVSTVLYVVQRMAQLSAMFSLLAVITYVGWRQAKLRTHARNSLLQPLGVALFVFLALMSKENGALVPVFLLVVEATIFRFRGFRTGGLQLWVPFAVLVALPLAAGALYTLLSWPELVAGYDSRPFGLAERLLTKVNALWHYVGLIVLPKLSEMGLYYDDFPVADTLDLWNTLGIAGIVGLLILAMAIPRRAPLVALGILWFFAAHALESTFLPLGLAFEHRNYLALAGPVLVLTAGLDHMIHSPNVSIRLSQGVSVAILALMALMTFARAVTWSSDETFHLKQGLHHPNSERALTELVGVKLSAGRPMEALQHIETLEELAPGDAVPTVLRLYVSCDIGYSEPDWMANAGKAIATARNPGNLLHYVNGLAEITRRGQCSAVQSQDILRLADAALTNPAVTPTSELESQYRLIRGQLLEQQGRDQEAMGAYEQAWRTSNHTIAPLLQMSQYYLRAGRPDAADNTLDRFPDAQIDEFSPREQRLLHAMRETINRQVQ